MKKRVICFFSLVLYLLLVCLLLSLKIEAEMMTQVKISERKNRGDSFGFNQSVLISDDEGRHLYEVINGSGWDSGIIAHKLPSSSWYIDQSEAVQFTGSALLYRFVSSASRPLQDGEKVAVIEKTEKIPDLYLYLYQDNIPDEYGLPQNSEVLAKTEHALLLKMNEAESPFFEQTARSLTDSTKLAERAFSLRDATQFAEMLPFLAGLAGVFLAGLVFWGLACLFAVLSEKHKIWVWLNVGLTGAALAVLAILLGLIELPASIMPADNIFQWQHYGREISLITDALKGFPDISMDFLAVKGRMLSLSSRIIYCSVVFLAAIPVTEGLFFGMMQRKQRRRQLCGRHDG